MPDQMTTVKSRLLRAVLVPLVLAVCCSWAARAADKNADPAIHEFVNTYFRSWSKADFTLYRSLFRKFATVTLLEGDRWQPWELSQFLDDQERLQSQQKLEEVPLAIDIKDSAGNVAFVEVSWRLNRGPGSSVTGKDWFTLVKEGEDWKVLNLTFWSDPQPKSTSSADPPGEGPAAAKPKIVVSGFEHFAGRSENASSEIAQVIVKAFPQLDIAFVQVPVVWGAPKQAITRTRPSHPTIWVAFGEGTSGFQIETVARNARGHGLDVKNETPAEKNIDPQGAPRLKGDFPAQALSDRLRGLGYDCLPSSDAGKHLCEEMLYDLLEEKNSPGAGLNQVVFIHVPVLGSMARVRGKKVPLTGESLRIAAQDIFEAIVAVLDIPAPK